MSGKVTPQSTPQYPGTDADQALQPSLAQFMRFSGLNAACGRENMAPGDLYYVENFLPVNKVAGQQGGPPSSTLRSTFNATAFPPALPGGDYLYWFVVQGRILVAVATYPSTFKIYEVSNGTIVGTFDFSSSTGNVLDMQAVQWNNTSLLVITPTSYFIYLFTDVVGSGPTQTINTSVTGTSIAVYQQRVWIGNGLTIQFTAPNTNNDFTTGDGAGAYLINTADYQLTGMCELNGFLYVLLPSGIQVVSNVQIVTTTTGGVTTSITTFNVYPISESIGCAYRNTIQVFNRIIVFMNWIGVYAINGGTVQKVSSRLDLIFSANAFLQNPQQLVANFNYWFQYSAGLVTWRGTLYYAVNVASSFFSGLSGTQQMNNGQVVANYEPFILLFDGSDWFIVRNYYTVTSLTGTKWVVGGVLQPGAPTGPINAHYLASFPYNTSYVLTASDQTFLFEMFKSADTVMPKFIRTALTPGPQSNWLMQKQSYRLFFGMTSYIIDTTTTSTLYIDTDTTDYGPNSTWYISASTYKLAPFDGAVIPKPSFYNADQSAWGRLYGLTLVTYLGDVEVMGMALQFKNSTYVGS